MIVFGMRKFGWEIEGRGACFAMPPLFRPASEARKEQLLALL